MGFTMSGLVDFLGMYIPLPEGSEQVGTYIKIAFFIFNLMCYYLINSICICIYIYLKGGIDFVFRFLCDACGLPSRHSKVSNRYAHSRALVDHGRGSIHGLGSGLSAQCDAVPRPRVLDDPLGGMVAYHWKHAFWG